MGWGSSQRSLLLNMSAWSRPALFDRAARVVPWLAAACAFALFISTASRDLTWRSYGADGGELITASMTLGIAHPPGYPLYLVIGRLFGLLPFGTVAARYALLSAVAAAAAVGVAVRCMTSGLEAGAPRVWLAWAVGLALAVTPLFWGQAILAEVYGLFLVFIALFTWAIMSRRSPLVVGLAFGLAVSGHLTGILLLPLALWKTDRSGIPRFVVGAAIGLAPFLLLPLLGAGDSPVIWGDPRSLAGWWWLVTARLYRPNVFGLPPTLWASRLVDWLNLAILVPLLLWLIVASLVAWRARRSWQHLPMALLLTAIAYILYAFTYRPEDSVVLLLPALLLFAIVAGRGLVEQATLAGWLAPLVIVALALLAMPGEDDRPLREIALARLSQVPTDAIVLTPGDATISALWYLNHVEGIRPDLTIIDANMFQFSWYRERMQADHPELWLPASDDLDVFLAQNSLLKPVCRFTLLGDSDPICGRPALEASRE